MGITLSKRHVCGFSCLFFCDTRVKDIGIIILEFIISFIKFINFTTFVFFSLVTNIENENKSKFRRNKWDRTSPKKLYPIPHSYLIFSSLSSGVWTLRTLKGQSSSTGLKNYKERHYPYFQGKILISLEHWITVKWIF